MIVYTYQSKEVVTKLFTEGKYEASLDKTNFVDDKNFVNAYIWMTKQLKDKKNQVCDSPVWVWVDVPDYYEMNEYLIILDIPIDKLLISSCNGFDAVLMDYPIYSEEEESNNSISKEQSWQRVFDYNWLLKHGYDVKDGTEQAVTSKITIEQVKYIFNPRWHGKDDIKRIIKDFEPYVEYMAF